MRINRKKKFWGLIEVCQTSAAPCPHDTAEVLGRVEVFYLVKLPAESVITKQNARNNSCHNLSLSDAAVSQTLLPLWRVSFRRALCPGSPCHNAFQLISAYYCFPVNWYSGGGWPINMLANKVIPVPDLSPTTEECVEMKKQLSPWESGPLKSVELNILHCWDSLGFNC